MGPDRTARPLCVARRRKRLATLLRPTDRRCLHKITAQSIGAVAQSAAATRLNADQRMQPLGGDLPRELKPLPMPSSLSLRHRTAIEREHDSRATWHDYALFVEIRAAPALSADGYLAQHSLRAAWTPLHACNAAVDTLLLLARLESGQHTQAPDPLDVWLGWCAN